MKKDVQYAKEISYTPDATLNAILSLKFLEIHNKKITLSHEIFLSDNHTLLIDSVKLSSIMNNIFDNAIEACMLVAQSPFISLLMKEYQSQLVIQLCNSCNGMYQYDNQNKLISTKSEPNHGIGLKRVHNLVKEAGGFLTIDAGEQKFCITIVLPYKN